MYISAPLALTADSVSLNTITKLEWINKRIEMVRNQSRQSVREYVSGENLYYKGIRCRLNVIYRNTPPSVVLKGTRNINIYVRQGSSSEKRGEVLREWYRAELKEALQTIAAK